MNMKRTYGALVGIVLMVVVIMASVGVTYVRCAHTGNVSMATASSMSGMGNMSDCQNHEDSADNGAAVKASHCMQVSLMKMLTQFQQPHTALHFECQTVAVVPFMVPLLPKPLVALARPLTPQTAGGYYGPPRSYLRRLGVLVI